MLFRLSCGYGLIVVKKYKERMTNGEIVKIRSIVDLVRERKKRFYILKQIDDLIM